ncbi:MAG TPA: hypothetical protein VM686_33025 [Polyangiaceae bacterium]|nr:hypothetical protein [Polyangiaceae bacterium]
MSVPPEEQEELLSPELERELELALHAAWHPAEIEPARHEQLLELALEDPLAPPTAEEIVESERLRQALEGDGAHQHLDLARALQAATRPTPPLRTVPVPEASPRVIYVAFGAATALLAAAAALALVIGSLSSSDEAPLSAQAPLAPAALSTSRSSAALFQEPFTLEGTTARMDRIANERERELRQNRYLAWGVR